MAPRRGAIRALASAISPRRGSIRLRTGAYCLLGNTALWLRLCRPFRAAYGFAACLPAGGFGYFAPSGLNAPSHERLLPFGQYGAFFMISAASSLGLPAIFFRQFIGKIRIAHAMQIRNVFADDRIDFGSKKKFNAASGEMKMSYWVDTFLTKSVFAEPRQSRHRAFLF